MNLGKKRGRTALAAFGVLIALGIAGCGGGNEGTSASSSTSATDGAKVLVGNSVPQLTDPGLSLQSEITEEMAAELGLGVDTVDANFSPTKQLADIKSLLQKGVKGLMVWPLVTEAVSPVIAEADQKDVPVVVRQTFTGGPYATNIATDDAGAGARMAKYLGDNLGAGAKVAAIVGPQQIATFSDFAEGFQRGASAAGLDVVETVVNQKATPTEAQALANQLKTRYGSDLDGLFVSLSTWATPIAQVVGGDFSPEIVTVGLDEGGVNAVDAGQVAAMDYVSVVALGRAQAWAMNAALENEELPQDLWIRYQLIDESTVGGLPSNEAQRSEASTFSIEQEGEKAYLEVSGTTIR